MIFHFGISNYAEFLNDQICICEYCKLSNLINVHFEDDVNANSLIPWLSEPE